LSADSVRILRENILRLIDKRRTLTSQISKYSRAEGSPSKYLIRLSELQQQLKDNEQILEFFWGLDSIYTISITDQSAKVSVIANKKELTSLLISARGMLEGKRSVNSDQAEDYSRTTFRIYQQLLQPVLEKLKVVVIPDGSLHLLPVDALVTSHQSETLTFRDLQYLIYDHEVTYAYSSSILFHQPRTQRSQINNVLAFSYSNEDGEVNAFRKDELSSLPGTYKELKSLSGIFKNVKPFTGPDARKSNFISHAKNHDLIHLAVHGIGDPQVIDNSRLIFRPDELEPGDLYAFDIYNLQIDAKLVVLSGCETGLGKQQTGEGVFSIARAFSYAGCPSVVMTMWRVPDTFTAPIVSEFYKRLHNGQSIGASLRASKLKFIEESDGLSAHPANWAEFVLNGEDQTFSQASIPTVVWILLLTVGMVSAYLVFEIKSFKSNFKEPFKVLF
jgi:CHAT domain-containing protein